MASAFRKDIARTVRNNLKRFISIMVITLLGVAMFCGLKASCSDLRAAADSFFDDQRLFDIQVLSTLGLTDADIAVLSQVEGVEVAEGGFQESAQITVNGAHASVDVNALSAAFNVPYVVEGELPQAAYEVAVTQAYLDDSGKKLGDTLALDEPQTADEALFERQDYTIVGVVIDPTNVNNSSGTMSFRSSSSADYTFFVSPEAVTSEVYSVAYVRVEGVQEQATFSVAYEQAVDAVKNRIANRASTQESQRTEEVREQAQQELDEGRLELDTQSADALSQLDAAEQTLEASRAELDAGAQELQTNQRTLDTQRAELDRSLQELNQAQAQLDQGKQEWQDATQMRSQLVAQLAQVQQGLQSIDAQVSDIPGQIATTEATLAQVQQELATRFPDGAPAAGSPDEGYYQQLVAQEYQLQQALGTLQGLQAQRESLVQAQASLQSGIAQIDTQTQGLSDAYFAHQQAQIDAARVQIQTGAAALADGQAQIDQGWREYYAGKEAWEQGWAEYESSRADAESELAAADAELLAAQSQIDGIELAQWYIQDRSSLSSYSSIQSDATSIEAIGTLFPLVFLVVGILVALTAITRMVEEQRGLIGTYKALGYRNREIYTKYLVYALGACVAGCGLGLLAGFIVLPEILFSIFDVMYVLPGYPLLFDPLQALIASAVFAVGIGVTAFIACRSEVKQKPAVLMRPKAPHAGSRIFLERIGFIWNRLSFLNKVTARNLTRYKKRFIMTVVGVMGCSALLVCGFAIKDSVAKLTPEQYERIESYDVMAVVQDSDYSHALEELQRDSRVEGLVSVRMDSVQVIAAEGEESARLLVVPEGESLEGFLNLYSMQGSPVSPPDQGALVTFNASDILGFEAQDTITVQESNLREASLTVEGIAENYLGNYVFMSQNAYESAFGSFAENAFLIKVDPNEDVRAFVDELGAEDYYLSLVSTQDMAESFNESVTVLNMIVLTILVMAAALAFTVLFTLATTNISERERELATIKVLGFRPSEVHHYVNKETLILTGIGAVIGLPVGFVLGDIVLDSLKMPSFTFMTYVEPLSFVLTVGITMAFALMVNLITNRSLDKIDMISALKSVE